MKLRLFLALALVWASSPAARAEETLVALNKTDSTASLIDPATGATRAVLSTGQGPHEVAIAADGRLAVVSDYGAEVPGRTLTVLDLEARRVARTIDLGDYRRPHGLAWIGKSSRLLVTAEVQAVLLEVDVEQGKVVRAIPTRANASHMVVATPDGTRAFVANIASGSVTAIDLARGEILASVETGAGCEGIDVSPDGRQVWTANREAGTVSVLDARELTVLATLEAPGFPIRVKLTPDGKRALVSCAEAGEVVVFDALERELVASIGMHPLREEEAGDEHMFGQAFGESTVPIGIQVHPDGTTAYVANSGVGRVAVLDLASLALRGSFETGQQPDGLGFASRP